MQPITDDLIRRAVEILGTEGLGDDEIKFRLLSLADNNDSLARRLLEWVPEGFGRMVVSRLGRIDFGSSFSVRDAREKWISIPNKEEPILESALRVAHEMFRDETLDAHQRIATRSATFNSADQVLASGSSLDGVISATAMIGLRAEDYPHYKPSFLKKLFGG